MCFLTSSYFDSKACINEVRAAKRNQKPIIVVRETEH